MAEDDLDLSDVNIVSGEKIGTDTSSRPNSQRDLMVPSFLSEDFPTMRTTSTSARSDLLVPDFLKDDKDFAGMRTIRSPSPSRSRTVAESDNTSQIVGASLKGAGNLVTAISDAVAAHKGPTPVKQDLPDVSKLRRESSSGGFGGQDLAKYALPALLILGVVLVALRR